MTTNFELIEQINTLAKKQYGESATAFAWGAAQSFLSIKELELILSLLKGNETNE